MGAPATAKRKRILVADDNAYYLTIIGDALSEATYELVTFSDGYAALQYITANRELDLAILNRELPGLSGMEIVARVRESGMKELLILIMDVFTKKGEEVADLKNSGASGYFNKSIPIEEIVYRINDLLFPPDRFSRRNPRAVVYIPVRYTIGEQVVHSYSFTLSADGMYIQALNPPAPRTELAVEFRLGDGQEITAKARVIYRYKYDPHRNRSILPGMAVRFTSLDGTLRAAINRMVVSTLVQSVRAQRETLGRDAQPTATEQVVTCPTCTGLGKVTYVTCTACGGSAGGCPICKGSGMNPFIRKVCPECRGVGSIRYSATADV